MNRKTDIVEIGDSSTNILTAGTNEKLAVNSLIIGNIDGTDDATLTIELTKSGESAKNIVKDLSITANNAVQFLVGGRDSIFLDEGDSISATASTASDVNVTISYLIESI